MAAGRINNSIHLGTRPKTKTQTFKAHTGNGTGRRQGDTNGGTKPQNRIKRIYEWTHNRFRKTEPRSTRGPLFREIQGITRQTECDRSTPRQNERRHADRSEVIKDNNHNDSRNSHCRITFNYGSVANEDASLTKIDYQHIKYMFVQIAPHVRVFLTAEQIQFVEKYKDKQSFTDRELDPEQAHIAKVLGDKAIFVRKKLDNGMQYALNRRIRFVKNANRKKT